MAPCVVVQMKEQMKGSLAVQVRGAKGPFESTFHTGYQVRWISLGDYKIGSMGCQNIPTGLLTRICPCWTQDAGDRKKYQLQNWGPEHGDQWAIGKAFADTYRKQCRSAGWRVFSSAPACWSLSRPTNA